MKIFFGTTDKYPYPSNMSDDMVIETLGRWRGEKVLKIKTESGRALSFCAGKTLKEAFGEFGLDILTVQPKILEDEKPFIDELSFNLSHSGEVALVAVSGSDGPIGCDVQKVLKKPVEKEMKIAERFFSVRECKKLQEMMQKNEGAAKLLFYLIFSAKEAYIKFTGEGIKKGLDTFEVPLDENLLEMITDSGSKIIEKYSIIDGEKLKFSYLFPDYIAQMTGVDRLCDEYVSVICEKV